MTTRYTESGFASGNASITSGEKVKLKKIVRSQKTGMVLPKEGTLVEITENFGKRLLLVAFDEGISEYLFDDEVECPVVGPEFGYS
jgi:hypothetical protein